MPDEELRANMQLSVKILEGLHRLSVAQARDRLAESLKNVVVPSTQLVEAMRSLIGLCRGYCESSYADSRDVLRLMYTDGPNQASPYTLPICFTGLAGVGKSVLLNCFVRMHSSAVSASLPHHAKLDLRPCWLLPVYSRASSAALLAPEFRRKDVTASPGVVARRVTSEAAAQGIAAILADEIQFLTQGNANVMATKLLLGLARIGPPLVYACNFSLVHRLWKRPQEDRDRLLANPMILWPDPEGPEWDAFVAELLKSCVEFSELDARQVSATLHSYSFGLRRTACSLLVLAYCEMRRRDASRVGQRDIAAAYRSMAFAAKRQDVEALLSGAMHKDIGRKDLLCPFPDRVAFTAGTARSATEERVQAATKAALESVLPPGSQRILDRIQSQGDMEPMKPSRPKRPVASVDNLIGGAEKFRDGLKKPKK